MRRATPTLEAAAQALSTATPELISVGCLGVSFVPLWVLRLERTGNITVKVSTTAAQAVHPGRPSESSRASRYDSGPVLW